MPGFNLHAVRCAVIGYGGAFNMGRTHGQQMNAAGMQTVAACDLDRARTEAALADFPGIRTYNALDDLLADSGVDLCVVILPHNQHAPVAIRCAEAGKHVIVEKPMSITTAEADAMIAAAKSNHVMLSVFHNRRWDGDFLAIQKLIKQDMIGEVFHIEACMSHFHEPGAWWRSVKAVSGGALYDWGAHIIDWMQLFIPEPISGVDGYFHKRRWHSRSVEDHTEAVIRFSSGKTAQIEMSSLAAVGKAKWRILGTKGAIVQAGWEDIEVTVEHAGHLAKFTVKPETTRWEAFYENIAGHLKHREELAVKPEEARQTIAIIEAAEVSSGKQTTAALTPPVDA